MTYEKFYDVAKTINDFTGNTCTEKEIACYAYDYICEYEYIIALPIDRRKINLGCLEMLMETMAEYADESEFLSGALEQLHKKFRLDDCL